MEWTGAGEVGGGEGVGGWVGGDGVREIKIQLGCDYGRCAPLQPRAIAIPSRSLSYSNWPLVMSGEGLPQVGCGPNLYIELARPFGKSLCQGLLFRCPP